MASRATTKDQQNHKQAQLENEIHDMISTLASLSTPSLSSASSPLRRRRTVLGESTEQGVRIITIAGENKGATMKGDCSEVMDSTSGMMYKDERTMSAVTNSNFQAVNNSIMLKGRCVAEDPGVHFFVVDDDMKE